MGILTFERITVSRWVRNGIIDLQSNPIVGVVSKEDIAVFLKKINYKDMKKSEKEVIAYAFSKQLIPNINEVSISSIEREVSNIRSNRVKEHYKSLSYEDKRARYDNRDTVTPRIEKIRKLHPDWTDEQCKRESYIEGMLTKGRRVAIELNLDPQQMTDKELMSLTGKTKSENFKNLTYEEKELKAISWKRTNLLNNNVRKLLTKEIPDFEYVDVMNLSNSDIVKFYSIYKSLISVSAIANGRTQRQSRFKSGYYFSEKNNKRHYYRSSYELECYQILDNNKRVKSFLTEPYYIKFFNDQGEYEFSYVPDIVAKLTTGDVIMLEPKGEYYFDNFMATKGNRILLEYNNFYILQKKQITEEYINDIIDQYFEHK